jgi:16S rRNA (cytosine967-C5)-methyltransferase
VAQSWQETIGGSSPGGERFLRLTPARHATDGFFVASFARKAADPTEPEPDFDRDEAESDPTFEPEPFDTETPFDDLEPELPP